MYVEFDEERVLCILRDGRHLVGFLRSFDQFSNFILESTVERRYVAYEYGDIPLGLYIVKGESVVLLGEIDPVRESDPRNPMKLVDYEYILDAERQREDLEPGSTSTEKSKWEFDKLHMD